MQITHQSLSQGFVSGGGGGGGAVNHAAGGKPRKRTSL